MSAPTSPRRRTHPTGHTRAHARVVTVGALAKVGSFPGQSYWISLFVEPLMAATGLSRAALSIAYACATLGSAGWSTRIGRIADALGVRTALLVASTGVVVGSVLLGTVTGFVGTVVALAIVRASGQGGMPLSGTLAIVRGMPEPRGRAMGISNSALTMAGGIVPLLAAVGTATIGWRATLVAAGAFVAALTVVQLALLRGVPGAHERRARTTRADRIPLGTPGRVLLLVLGLAPLTVTAVAFHAAWYGRAAGFGQPEVAACLALLAVAGIAGALLSGVLVDRFGVRHLLGAVCVLTALAPPLVASGAALPFVLGFLLLGLANGASGVASSVGWSRTYGDEQIGRLQGIGAAGVIVAASLGPLVPSLPDAAGAPPLVGGVVMTVVATLALVSVRAWRPLIPPGGI